MLNDNDNHKLKKMIIRRIFSLSPIFYSHDARPKKEGVNDQHFAPLLLPHWLGLQREIYKEEASSDGIEVHKRSLCSPKQTNFQNPQTSSQNVKFQ